MFETSNAQQSASKSDFGTLSIQFGIILSCVFHTQPQNCPKTSKLFPNRHKNFPLLPEKDILCDNARLSLSLPVRPFARPPVRPPVPKWAQPQSLQWRLRTRRRTTTGSGGGSKNCWRRASSRLHMNSCMQSSPCWRRLSAIRCKQALARRSQTWGS